MLQVKFIRPDVCTLGKNSTAKKSGKSAGIQQSEPGLAYSCAEARVRCERHTQSDSEAESPSPESSLSEHSCNICRRRALTAAGAVRSTEPSGEAARGGMRRSELAQRTASVSVLGARRRRGLCIRSGVARRECGAGQTPSAAAPEAPRCASRLSGAQGSPPASYELAHHLQASRRVP